VCAVRDRRPVRAIGQHAIGCEMALTGTKTAWLASVASDRAVMRKVVLTIGLQFWSKLLDVPQMGARVRSFMRRSRRKHKVAHDRAACYESRLRELE
jgi:hypothetical protein